MKTYADQINIATGEIIISTTLTKIETINILSLSIKQCIPQSVSEEINSLEDTGQTNKFGKHII